MRENIIYAINKTIFRRLNCNAVRTTEGSPYACTNHLATLCNVLNKQIKEQMTKETYVFKNYGTPNRYTWGVVVLAKLKW